MSYYNHRDGRPKWANITIFVSTAFGLIVAVVIAGWQLGWWLTDHNTQRTDQNYRASYGNQTAQRENVSKNIQLVLTETSQIDGVPADSQQAVDLSAQRVATVAIVCGSAAQISQGPDDQPLDPGVAQFVSANCLAGAVNPSSKYNQ